MQQLTSTVIKRCLFSQVLSEWLYGRREHVPVSFVVLGDLVLGGTSVWSPVVLL